MYSMILANKNFTQSNMSNTTFLFESKKDFPKIKTTKLPEVH